MTEENLQDLSLLIDPDRTGRLQETAKKINTRYTNPEDFVDDALGYFINMWEKPQWTYSNFISYTKHMPEEQREFFKQYGKKIKNDIEEKEKTIGELNNVGEFITIENTEFRYPVEPTRDGQIQKLMKNNAKLKNYLHGGTTNAFVNEAIDTFILLWSEPIDFQIKVFKIYELLKKEVIEFWKENYPEEFEFFIIQYNQWKNNETKNVKNKNSENKNSEINFNVIQMNHLDQKDFKKILTKCTSGNTESLHRKQQAFMSQFNGRFFPIKLVTRRLAEMIYQNDGKMIDYKTFSDECYEYALSISKKLKELENDKQILRNKKFSTGLPVKDEANVSKKRFKDHYIGIEERTWKNRQRNDLKPTFDGSLNSCKLAYFQVEQESKKSQIPRIKIGITKKGIKFAGYSNQILDDLEMLKLSKDNWKNPLTVEESEFIQKEVLEEFPLEKYIVQNVMKEIKNTKNRKKCPQCGSTKYACSHVIDQKFHEWTSKFLDGQDLRNTEYDDIDFWLERKGDKDEKYQHTIQQLRTSTMGRLSELGMLEWKISKKEENEKEIVLQYGTSYYTISE